MPKFFRSRLLFPAIALTAVLGASGIWALLHPGGMWLQHWRAERSAISTRFIFGPYPLRDDFPSLKKLHVATIISLLDPDLPYEKILLAQERVLAQRYGIRVLNFPMASILGQSFGKDYLANSRAAAQAAIDSPGVAYIHCYLGLHRAKNVQRFLEGYAATGTTNYSGSLASGRSADVLSLDRANIAFLEGDPARSLKELASIKVPGYQATLLQGWSNFRLGRIALARTAFTSVLSTHPDDPDAGGGLGYCALRDNDLVAADAHFSAVLARHPDDAQAIEGLGHVRFQQNRLAEAKTLFERVMAQHPENTEVRDSLKKLEVTP
ncbi:MAG: tetratricopeptide repeat protein [Arenimonas sp.]